MSKLIDDLNRAAEARRKLGQNRIPDQTHSGFDETKPGHATVRRQAEDSTRHFLAWRQAERAARELSTREVARRWLARWLLAAVAFSTAIAIGIGSVLTTGYEPAAVSAAQPTVQMQPGPPLQLRLETDLERIGQHTDANASERSAD